jgi:hydrogenase/urease accessory protein HupE
MKPTVAALLILLASPLALAHPGEHHMGLLAGLLHLLSEPDHLALLLIALVIGVSAGLFYRRRERARSRDPRQ